MKRSLKTSVVMLALLMTSVLMLSACGEVKDGKYAELAKCLTKEGVKFYGAFWCPHCQEQKAMFGDDLRYVTFVECDPRDPKADPADCAERKIDRYPTWFFPGQGNETGYHTAEELAKKSGCTAALSGTEQVTSSQATTQAAVAPSTVQNVISGSQQGTAAAEKSSN